MNQAYKEELEALRGSAEPVAWALIGHDGKPYRTTHDRRAAEAYKFHEVDVRPLYTRPCVPLTDAQIWSLAYDTNALPEVITDASLLRFARVIEAVHGIGEKK